MSVTTVLLLAAHTGFELIVKLYANELILLYIAVLAIAVIFYSEPQSSIQSRHSVSHGGVVSPQGEEAAATAHVAEGNHAQAACSYTRAAEQYNVLAASAEEQSHYWDAAELYVKAAAMYAAAGEQGKLHLPHVLTVFQTIGQIEQASFVGLVADYAEMDNYKNRQEMHASAALCYHAAAIEYTSRGLFMPMRKLSRAAAAQYEASADCALVYHDHGSAAYSYSRAAEKYAEVDNDIKARAMKAAEGPQYEAKAKDQITYDGDPVGAVHSLRSATMAYEASGHDDKARSMNEAIVRLHESGATKSAIRARDRRVAGHYCDVADAYEALGQADKAETMRRAAAEGYKAAAMDCVRGNKKTRAVVVYRKAAAVYERIGEYAETQSMIEAAVWLEDNA